jgi:hypothetical protein
MCPPYAQKGCPEGDVAALLSAGTPQPSVSLMHHEKENDEDVEAVEGSEVSAMRELLSAESADDVTGSLVVGHASNGDGSDDGESDGPGGSVREATARWVEREAVEGVLRESAACGGYPSVYDELVSMGKIANEAPGVKEAWAGQFSAAVDLVMAVQGHTVGGGGSGHGGVAGDARVCIPRRCDA